MKAAMKAVEDGYSGIIKPSCYNIMVFLSQYVKIGCATYLCIGHVITKIHFDDKEAELSARMERCSAIHGLWKDISTRCNERMYVHTYIIYAIYICTYCSYTFTGLPDYIKYDLCNNIQHKTHSDTYKINCMRHKYMCTHIHLPKHVHMYACVVHTYAVLT